jgi:hypothetical protein
MIAAQEAGQDLGIEGITLRAADPEAIAGPVQALGVDGVDDDAMIQQVVNDAAMGPLDGRPELDAVGLALPQPPPPFSQAGDGQGDSATHHLVADVIDNPDGCVLVCPVHTDVVAHKFLLSPVQDRSLEREQPVRLISVLRGTTSY